jgi:hypothetical protein
MEALGGIGRAGAGVDVLFIVLALDLVFGERTRVVEEEKGVRVGDKLCGRELVGGRFFDPRLELGHSGQQKASSSTLLVKVE